MKVSNCQEVHQHSVTKPHTLTSLLSTLKPDDHEKPDQGFLGKK